MTPGSGSASVHADPDPGGNSLCGSEYETLNRTRASYLFVIVTINGQGEDIQERDPVPGRVPRLRHRDLRQHREYRRILPRPVIY